MTDERIYLDNHATTRCDPRVVEAMLPYFDFEYGNAHSAAHVWGTAAHDAVEQARHTIASAIGAADDEIVFTSGATESNNLAIRGTAERPRRRGQHLVSSAIEHPSVLEPLRRLERQDLRLTLVGVAPHGKCDAGLVDLDQLAAAINDDACLVSVMLASNEIGTIQPLAAIGQLCRARGVPLHCDATQAVGKIPVDVATLSVDLMSFTAHKLYGPKGVGALYVRGGVKLLPQNIGGGQQDGRRAGTMNVPGIVGFAKAVELCMHDLAAEAGRLTELRDSLAASLLVELKGSEICGPALDARDEQGQPLRLPHNLNLLIPGQDGQSLLLRMPQVALSSGAACSSTSPEPSHVLRALGLDDDRVRSSIRIGLGRFSTAAELPSVVTAITRAVDNLYDLG